MPEQFVRLFNFKFWADERTLSAIEQIDVDKFPNEMRFARQQLNHLVIVQELFRARLLGETLPHEATNTEQIPEFDELAERFRSSNDWFKSYVANRDLEDDNDELPIDFTDGKTGRMSRQEVLFHLVNHASYHRGTIARNLDLAGVAHPADIFTLYLHEAEPERRNQ